MKQKKVFLFKKAVDLEMDEIHFWSESITYIVIDFRENRCNYSKVRKKQ